MSYNALVLGMFICASVVIICFMFPCIYYFWCLIIESKEEKNLSTSDFFNESLPRDDESFEDWAIRANRQKELYEAANAANQEPVKSVNPRFGGN